MKILGHRWVKGLASALGPPVAMYFHKKQLIFSKYRSLYSQNIGAYILNVEDLYILIIHKARGGRKM